MNADEKLIALMRAPSEDYQCGHVVIPRATDLNKALADWRKWRSDCFNGRNAEGKRYIFFEQWLIDKVGARLANNDDIEEFDEDFLP